MKNSSKDLPCRQKLILKLHQPKKWQKIKYVTDSDIYELENLIYNDLDITHRYDDSPDNSFVSFLDNIMVEDEIWSILPEVNYDYAITSFGRVISAKRYKNLKITIYRNTAYFALRRVSYKISDMFLSRGWVYSNSFIRGKYEEYGWDYYDARK